MLPAIALLIKSDINVNARVLDQGDADRSILDVALRPDFQIEHWIEVHGHARDRIDLRELLRLACSRSTTGIEISGGCIETHPSSHDEGSCAQANGGKGTGAHSKGRLRSNRYADTNLKARGELAKAVCEDSL